MELKKDFDWLSFVMILLLIVLIIWFIVSLVR